MFAYLLVLIDLIVPLKNTPNKCYKIIPPNGWLHMTEEYLDLKMDFMFKQLFGDPRRKNITMAFLNDLLHRKGMTEL